MAPSLSATTLAQFVRLQSCERYLWYRLHNSETRELFRDWRLTEQPLTPLLSESGETHESAVADELSNGEGDFVDLDGLDLDTTVSELRGGAVSAKTLAQPKVEGTIHGFEARGIPDFVLVQPGNEGGVSIKVVDAKASRVDRPEHRLQVAFYAIVLREMLVKADLAVESVKGGIWRIPEDEEDEQPVMFDLAPYEEAILMLLEDGGLADSLAEVPKEGASYHLTYRCDGCMYNALCMREAAESKSLALVPFLSQRDRRALEQHGIQNIGALAALKDLPPRGSREAVLKPAPGEEELVEALNSEWPLGANLDLHVQRARAAARRRDGATPALGWIHMAGFGSCPDPAENEGLVQVFIDSQHDFINDRTYLVAALLVGPTGEFEEVIEMAAEPPDDPIEEALIVRWAERLLETLSSVAGAELAPVHIYVYDRYDQKVLLDALRRNLDALAGIPDFFDLLTETAALSQSMFSFLSEEVQERKNLGMVCHSLPMVARRLGFNWDFDGIAFQTEFRARVFDNSRTLPNEEWYESASRFNSQIPLEYSYGAWGVLPDDQEYEELLKPYRVDVTAVRAFARARLHALRHVEGALFRSKYLEKPPIVIPNAAKKDGEEPSLARVLEEFLLIEHHTKLQQLLLLYAEPVDRRVARGESLLIEALEGGDGGDVRFRVRFDEVGLDPAAALAQMGPQEGSWMVISEASKRQTPGRILHGRVAVIKAIDGDTVLVELLPLSFNGSSLRYWHQQSFAVTKGRRYVLDPMADDLVGERMLLACRDASTNHLLQWVEAGSSACPNRVPGAGEEEGIAEFLEAVRSCTELVPPTARQLEAMGSHLDQHVILVQGPPGTGKTHTIGWAVLARLYARAAQGSQARVLVTAMTHTAVAVVLDSVARKIELLKKTLGLEPFAEAVGAVHVLKECSDLSDSVPDGVVAVDKSALRAYEEEQLVIVGAVPGGTHRLLQGWARKAAVDWDEKLYDYLVIDEASQVTLPAAVLAGAALKADGQAIVVGDHRQMPPILTHDWDSEHRRGIKDSEAYASTFEALISRGFPWVRLDQSFRLHEAHAAFLDTNVYGADEVGYHSLQTHTLARADGLDGHVKAALDPDQPVVLIEHNEHVSLKRNDLEIAIIAPIIEAAVEELGLDGHEGIGVVVPHRSQRAALAERFPGLAAESAIDTVERFQGGERDLIIVSATASDPDFVMSEAKFLLNANRLNVAFSRPRMKLIVVGSSTIFRLLPPDMETFENALLWKQMRIEFGRQELWRGEINETQLSVSGAGAVAG